MNKVRIRAQHALTGKTKTGKVDSEKLNRTIKILAAHGYIVYWVITIL